MREFIKIEISEELSGERIDVALSKATELSRSAIVKLLDAGEVQMGKRKIGRAHV